MTETRDTNALAKAGVPVTIERNGDRVTILADGFGDVSDRFTEAVEELLGTNDESFLLEGAAILYRGWTVQPREVCEAFLESPDETKGIRSLMLIHDVERIGDRGMEAEDVDRRSRLLAEMIPDSEHIQKRNVREWLSIQDSAWTRTRRQEIAGQDSSDQEDRSDVSVDVLYSCGYLDLEGVETRLARMKREIEDRDSEASVMRERLDQEQKHREALEPVLDVGREALDKFRHEANSRLRVVQISRGIRPEDGARRAILESEDSDSSTIREIHRRITEEFRALYPTEPLSVSAGEPTSKRVRWDWNAFRI